MLRRRIRLTLGWLAAAASLFLLALYILSLPFYAGSSLGPQVHWRLEHARLTLRWGGPGHPEPLWVDANSEGLKFGWGGRWGGLGDWQITVPLWAPLLITGGLGTYSLWPRRTALGGACPRCGYSLAGLPPGTACSECGHGGNQ